MIKKDHGFTCTKHWNSVLVDKHMIIHRIVHSTNTVLCDSKTFDDGEKLYDRKGVKTLTPIGFEPGISIGPFLQHQVISER